MTKDEQDFELALKLLAALSYYTSQDVAEPDGRANILAINFLKYFAYEPQPLEAD